MYERNLERTTEMKEEEVAAIGGELGLEDPTKRKVVAELLDRSLSVYQMYQRGELMIDTR